MSQLNKIIERCKCGVYLNINTHKDVYQTTEEAIEEIQYRMVDSGCDPLDDYLVNRMIHHDIIINLQFYPNTPISSYGLYHYDLDEILDIAVDIIEQMDGEYED